MPLLRGSEQFIALMQALLGRFRAGGTVRLRAGEQAAKL